MRICTSRLTAFFQQWNHFWSLKYSAFWFFDIIGTRINSWASFDDYWVISLSKRKPNCENSEVGNFGRIPIPFTVTKIMALSPPIAISPSSSNVTSFDCIDILSKTNRSTYFSIISYRHLSRFFFGECFLQTLSSCFWI